ncbi:MAG: hypothetical protein ACU85E_02915 [Gammaproteobacteria bacterium]
MKSGISISVLSFLVLCSKNLFAAQVTVPVPIAYDLIKNILIGQLYTDQNSTAHIWRDGHGCSFLDLSKPKLDGRQGLVRMTNDVHTRLGTAFNGQCLPLLEWTGQLETFQQPQLDASGTVMSFPVTKAIAYDRNGRTLTINQMQDLIKRFAEPKLASIKIDLNEARDDIEKTVAQFVPADNKPQVQALLDSLKFSDVTVGDTGLTIKIGFEAPIPKEMTEPSKPPEAFSEEEIKQWEAAWREWDVFLTDAIKQATADTQSEELRETLLDILLEARNAFQAGLKHQNNSGKDPVRTFFNTTWERLAPVLRSIAGELPGTEGLRYLTFIAATDVLYELESIGTPLGLEISSEGLRRLGRLLIAKRSKSPD